MKKLVNFILLIIGTVFVLLGLIGLLVPVMPTTIFLMVAGLCYINSSKRLYNYLINLKYIGPTIKSYVEKRSVTRKFKIYSLLFLYIPTLITQIFIVKNLMYRIIPLVLLIIITWHILSLNTVEKSELNSDIENNSTNYIDK